MIIQIQNPILSKQKSIKYNILNTIVFQIKNVVYNDKRALKIVKVLFTLECIYRFVYIEIEILRTDEICKLLNVY
jgi:hypothetical protein